MELLNIKSIFTSKIFLTQAVAAIASLLAVFGFDLPAELQAQIVLVIQTVAALVTMIMRQYFTTSLTEPSARKLLKQKATADLMTMQKRATAITASEQVQRLVDEVVRTKAR